MFGGIKMNSENLAGEKELGIMMPEMIALIGGIISAIIFVIPISALLGFLGSLVAPLVEEPFKVCGLVLLALYYPYTLATKRKGIILGGLAGLGFAFTENFLYLIRAETGQFGEGVAASAASVALVRAIFPLSMHICCSAIVGCGLVFLAQKKFDRSSLNISIFLKHVKSRDTLSFLVIAMALHFQYNFLCNLPLIGMLIGVGIGFYVFYKLYYYLPERLYTLKITGPVQLLSDAIRSKKGKPIGQIISDVVGSGEERPTVKFCSKCGAELKHDASFCPKCGVELKKR
jgi:RsiW-degrading membrane proteinase PrsW (M82 family)